MTPRVTVLLAVHNGEPYVRDAVESVLDQTHRDFEFVIVDDASTDGTVVTIESFDDARIRLFRNERNLGQVPSLNRGLREARGAIVARIDADDVSRPTRLERQLAVLDADPRIVGLCQGGENPVQLCQHLMRVRYPATAAGQNIDAPPRSSRTGQQLPEVPAALPNRRRCDTSNGRRAISS